VGRGRGRGRLKSRKRDIGATVRPESGYSQPERRWVAVLVVLVVVVVVVGLELCYDQP
jgi:hypothetical protein